MMWIFICGSQRRTKFLPEALKTFLIFVRIAGMRDFENGKQAHLTPNHRIERIAASFGWTVEVAAVHSLRQMPF